MMQYTCLSQQIFVQGSLRIAPVQPHEIEAIRKWRNDQLDVLRQKYLISHEEQQRYYRENVWPIMSKIHPPQILVSYYDGDNHVGYGGLVHMVWDRKEAELSFLLDPAKTRDHAIYQHYHWSFIELIKNLAFSDLGFNSIITETYSHRIHHIANLEEAGFMRRKVIKDSCKIGGEFVDSIIHVYTFAHGSS